MATTEPTQVLDVRDVDGEPFGHIDATLSELDDGDRLLLVNGFEPVPLYDVLSERGFAYETEQVGPAEWHVTIQRG